MKYVNNKGLSQDDVKRLFEYRDGLLYWKISFRGTKKGELAGTLRADGYRQVTINSTAYMHHRLVFLYHHGYMPENKVDHINRVKSDNRIENLREVSNSCNTINSKNRDGTSSGVRGVYFESGKWRARIKARGTVQHLGFTEDFMEAVCLRLAAEQCLGWEGCDSSSPAYNYVSCHIPYAKGV